MSREYEVEATLLVWDYIFAGMMDIQGTEGYDGYELRAPQDDPLVNLEFLSVAMITLLREDLLDSDSSTCLGLLMSYKVPADTLTVLKRAKLVRNAYLYATPYDTTTTKLVSKLVESVKTKDDDWERLDEPTSEEPEQVKSIEQTPSNTQSYQSDFQVVQRNQFKVKKGEELDPVYNITSTFSSSVNKLNPFLESAVQNASWAKEAMTPYMQSAKEAVTPLVA